MVDGDEAEPVFKYAHGTCVQCGLRFISVTKTKKSKRKYCSRSCIWKATKGPEYNAAIAKASACKRGDLQRGKGSLWYVKENGRHQHRVVAERMLGRPLRKGEIVHHKDGNKKNNDPFNLEVMFQGKHMQEHGIGIPGMTLSWKPWTYRRKKVAP